MPSESLPAESFDAFDLGLLSPLTAGRDALVSDTAVLDALVDAELALVRAWADVGAVPEASAQQIAEAWARDARSARSADSDSARLDVVNSGRADSGRADSGRTDLDLVDLGRADLGRAGLDRAGPDLGGLAIAAVAGGNPVIPLIPLLKQALPAELRRCVHRGATSQDIVDTALMLVARRAVDQIVAQLRRLDDALSAFAIEHRDVVAAARTLTQHAVPTTVGSRAAGWLSGIRRARTRLEQLVLPAQLGGAAGTRASFLELGGDSAATLPVKYAHALGLDHVDEVWHTSRWPVTELGDALTQTVDALGKLAGDVATLSRTEIAELRPGGGGSSSMPQKSNPVGAVLLRSGAIRAPQLAATLHLCAALAADERPDGAWHAEWTTLRELLRITLGASAHGAELVSALRVDRDAVARTLGETRGLLLAERISIRLTPLIGADRVACVIADAAAGGDLRTLVTALPEASDLDVDELLDPARYTGEAGPAVDRATRSTTVDGATRNTMEDRP